MINRNWLAYIFITDEDCLSISSKEKNLDRLLGVTLFRQTGDHEKLKAKEIKILSDSYNINYLDFSKYNILTPPLMRTGKAAFGCSIAPSSSIIATIIAHGLSRISVRHAKIKKLIKNQPLSYIPKWYLVKKEKLVQKNLYKISKSLLKEEFCLLLFEFSILYIMKDNSKIFYCLYHG